MHIEEHKVKLFWSTLHKKLSKLDDQDLKILSLAWPKLESMINTHEHVSSEGLYESYIKSLREIFSSSPGLQGALGLLKDETIRFSANGFIKFQEEIKKDEKQTQIDLVIPAIKNEIVVFGDALISEIQKRSEK